MTGSVAGAPSAAVMTTVPAVGAQRAAWLLLAFPLAGAVILLLGGKRTNSLGAPGRRGHAGRRASCTAVIAFVAMLGYPASQRSRDLHLFSWIPVGAFKVNIGAAARPAVDLLRAADHRGRLADPHLRGRLHVARPRAAPVLRVHEPVPGRDAAARAGRQLPRPVRGLGGRRPGLLPADRVLAVQAAPRRPRPRRRSSPTGSATPGCPWRSC